MQIILSHGRGGSPEDAIIQTLQSVADNFGIPCRAIHDPEIAEKPDLRAAKLIELVNTFPTDEAVILAGFSMGGYTSVLAAESCQHVRGLFLVAPGLYLPHYDQHRYRSDLLNVEIIHGWSDDVVIYEHSLRFARELNAPLHLLPGSHMLLSQMPRIADIFSNYLKRLQHKLLK